MLHAAMLRISELWPAASKAQRYRRMKQRVKRANFSMTQRNFSRLCEIWDAAKTPESLIRKRRPGLPRTSAAHVAAVVRFAITTRQPLSASLKILLKMDPSVPTLHAVKGANPPTAAIRKLCQLNRRRLHIEGEISRVHDEAMEWFRSPVPGKAVVS